MIKNKLYNVLIHSYMFFNFIGVLLLATDISFDVNQFLLGSCSWMLSHYISVGDMGIIVNYFALGWFLIFPIVLVISYVFAIKKHYLQFGIVVMADNLFVLVLSVAYLLGGNVDAFCIVLPNVIVGIVYITVILKLIKDRGDKGTVCRTGGQGDGSVGDEETREPSPCLKKQFSWTGGSYGRN